MSRYKLITFDITGTLLKFNQAPGVHYSRVGALFGVTSNCSDLNKSFRQQWKYLNKHKPNFGVNHSGWEDWWSEIVSGTFTNAGVKCDRKTLNLISRHLIDKYTTSSCWDYCDGATELLEQLRFNRVPVGVISNFDSRLHSILENMNIKHFFNFVLTSYEFGHTKPDKRIFMEALNRVNKSATFIEPKDVLHVGDTPQIDHYGAKSVGFNSWIITDNNDDTIETTSDNNNLVHTAGNINQLRSHIFNQI